MVVESVYLSIAPFIAAFVALALFGKTLRRHSAILAIVMAALSLAIVSMGFLEFKKPFEINFNWLSFGNINFQFGFSVDNISMLFALLVSFVSLLVFVYSSYMSSKEDLPRFYAEMSLFAGSMLGLVFSSNFVTLLIFWEIVGLSSYLLIGFWYDKKGVAAAAKRAFVIILLGDISMIGGVALLSAMFPSLDFNYLNANAAYSSSLVLALALVLVGAFAKSAQFPLHVWLGDAMEGPTPVSTLLHSATMVKAGIFVIARLLPMFGAANMLFPISLIGLLSAFVGATIAFSELDIKRILAFSTVSQLGFMTLALGMNNLGASMLYSVAQTFSKAAIFMIAGIVLHRFNEERDIRKVFFVPGSGLFLIALIGSLGVAGLPPLSDFWGKDGILGSVYSYNTVFFAFTMLTSFVSALYMSRWLFLPAGNFSKISNRASLASEENGKAIPLAMLAPALILLAGVLVAGIFSQPVLVFFGGTETVNMPIALTETAVVVAAVAISYAVFYRGIMKPEMLSNGVVTGLVYRVFANKYWIDVLYNRLASSAINLVFGGVDWFDRNIVDGAVNMLHPVTTGTAGIFKRAYSGLAENHVAGIFVGLVLIIVLIQVFRMMGGL